MSAPPELVERAVAGFRDAFGRAPECIAWAPGRVNLIGEHTDYNDGFVLPCAIPFGTVVALASRADARIESVAIDEDDARDGFAFSDSIERLAEGEWANHVRGVTAGLAVFDLPCGRADIAIAGNVPQGAGLSSSASLGVALGLGLSSLAGDTDRDRATLAKVAQWSEHHFVGTACGIMDQLASACGRDGAALLIDCRSLDVQPVDWPEAWAVMIVHSGVARELAASAYNERRAQCEAAAQHYDVAALRDLDAATLEAGRGGLDPVIFRRARHVVTENARTLAAAEAAVRHDLAAFGHAMRQSHASLRDDFEVSMPPVDALVDALDVAIGEGGGARMTGGGFGGCVVAVFDRSRVGEVDAALSQFWQASARTSPLQIVVAPTSGAALLRDYTTI